MKRLKKTGKICTIALLALCAPVLLTVGVLNIAKFALYRDYYAAESSLCRNPGLNDGFVCQGICFTPDGKIVLSTSYGLKDSVYYIYDRDNAVNSGQTLDGAPVYYLEQAENEINGPAMAEGMDYFREKIITLTESASDGKLFFATDIVSLDLNSMLP